MSLDVSERRPTGGGAGGVAGGMAGWVAARTRAGWRRAGGGRVAGAVAGGESRGRAACQVMGGRGGGAGASTPTKARPTTDKRACMHARFAAMAATATAQHTTLPHPPAPSRTLPHHSRRQVPLEVVQRF